MAIKFREIIELIEENGWYQVRQKGSHRQFKHDVKTGVVTVAYHRQFERPGSGGNAE